MADTATHHGEHHPADLPDSTVDVSKVRLVSLIALAVGGAAFFVGGFVGLGMDPERGVRDFFMAYLVGFVFWACVPFGSLLLSFIGYLAQASWGIIFRRIFQASIRTLPLLFVLGLPVLAGLYYAGGDQSGFWWSHSTWDGVTEEQKKHHAADAADARVKAAKDPSAAEGKREGYKADATREFNDTAKKYIAQEMGTDFEKEKEKADKAVADGSTATPEEKAKAKEWLAKYEKAKKVAEIAVMQGVPPESAEESLHKIHDWLNKNGFAIRYCLYFAIVGLFAFLLHRQARKAEDVSDTEKEKYKLHVISGPGIPIFVLTMTFFVTDWVMSFEPTWASSMFPVVFMFNMALTTLTFSTLVFYTLTKVPGDTGPLGKRPDLTAIVKDKFRIDIGSLTLGFCMAWSYASFCQFMLVWAGNLPEEIPYYLRRGAGNEDSFVNGIGGGPTGNASGWIYLTYILMAFHWLLPFITLLFREVKTSPRGMKLMACLLLFVCACDVIWWVLPSVTHPNTWLHVPMAFGAILMVGGIWAVVFAWQLGKRPILPKNSETKFLAEWGHH